MIVSDPDRTQPNRGTASPRSNRRRVAGIVVTGLATVLGCLPMSCTPGRSAARTDLAWPWWPNRMWVSDITRVGRPDADGLRRLEVRVCFEDPVGDPAKACGELELRITRSTEPDDPVVILADLDDAATSGRFHERVTGCYMVPVEVDLPGLVAGRRLRIQALYRGRDGAVLRDDHEVTLDGPMRP